MKKLRITIGNKSYDVTVEDLTEADPYQATIDAARSAASVADSPSSSPSSPSTSGNAPPRPQLPVEAGAVTSPMAGVIKSVLVGRGDSVTQGKPLVVLEAMKMENQITAPVAGTVKSVQVKEDDSVTEGHVLLVLE